jgi:hypothetical protein
VNAVRFDAFGRTPTGSRSRSSSPRPGRPISPAVMLSRLEHEGRADCGRGRAATPEIIPCLEWRGILTPPSECSSGAWRSFSVGLRRGPRSRATRATIWVNAEDPLRGLVEKNGRRQYSEPLRGEWLKPFESMRKSVWLRATVIPLAARTRRIAWCAEEGYGCAVGQSTGCALRPEHATIARARVADRRAVRGVRPPR